MAGRMQRPWTAGESRAPRPGQPLACGRARSSSSGTRPESRCRGSSRPAHQGKQRDCQPPTPTPRRRPRRPREVGERRALGPQSYQRLPRNVNRWPPEAITDFHRRDVGEDLLSQGRPRCFYPSCARRFTQSVVATLRPSHAPAPAMGCCGTGRGLRWLVAFWQRRWLHHPWHALRHELGDCSPCMLTDKRDDVRRIGSLG